jgi:hypothetical protein
VSCLQAEPNTFSKPLHAGLKHRREHSLLSSLSPMGRHSRFHRISHIPPSAGLTRRPRLMPKTWFGGSSPPMEHRGVRSRPSQSTSSLVLRRDKVAEGRMRDTWHQRSNKKTRDHLAGSLFSLRTNQTLAFSATLFIQLPPGLPPPARGLPKPCLPPPPNLRSPNLGGALCSVRG